MTMTLSDGLRKSIQKSKQIALKLGHENLLPEHLMLGLIDGPENTAVQALENLGVEIEKLRDKILGKYYTR